MFSHLEPSAQKACLSVRNPLHLDRGHDQRRASPLFLCDVTCRMALTSADCSADEPAVALPLLPWRSPM